MLPRACFAFTESVIPCNAFPKPKLEMIKTITATNISRKVIVPSATRIPPNQKKKASAKKYVICDSPNAPPAFAERETAFACIMDACTEYMCWSSSSIPKDAIVLMLLTAWVTISEEAAVVLSPRPRLPFITAICTAPAAAMIGITPRPTRVICHEKANATPRPMPRVDKFIAIRPICSPVKDFIKVASLANRPVTAPAEFSGRSNQPMSCRKMELNASERMAFVRASPDLANPYF
mmetsp:Transcript_28312/g.39365  ORF Transcript_28312/g.39365 Transcript_28312/m.39365 type:complete len:236 (-) Transcript_28312:1269-1976(-)